MFKRDTRQMRRDNPDIYDLITDPNLISSISGIPYGSLFEID